MQEHDLKKLIEMLKNAGAEQKVSDASLNLAAAQLTDTQKSKVNALLQDPEKLKKLLDSPIAKKMISELQDK